ncbi:hypothetical protein [Acidovorax sp.]|uniref:hypothetical protein n=1 Tax=Acidovorax sp. TaxID=1872122 RepID=UPI0025C46C6B|nr:hypothetical protein [Acidovorax sp.]
MSKAKISRLRQVVEENLGIAQPRWEYLKSNGNCLPFGVDFETSAVLDRLSASDLRDVCDVGVPLACLSASGENLESLAANSVGVGAGPKLADSAIDPLVIVAEENLRVLTNRWAALKEDEVSARILYRLSEDQIQWLRHSTMDDLKRVSVAGHPCVRFAVSPKYFFHCRPHLAHAQRTALALTTSTRRGR